MTTRRFFRTAPPVVLIPLLTVALSAQAPIGPASAPAAEQAAPQPPAPGAETPRLSLTAGRSLILTTAFDVTRIAVTNPNIADATVVQPREILIDGKAAGTVSLVVWGAADRTQYDVVVDAGVSTLQQQLNLVFPGETIAVNQTPEAVILMGRASNNSVMLRAGEIAEAMAPKSKVINMLTLPGGGPESQQVMLQVRVAEVNRRAITELGSSLFTGATGYKDIITRSTTQQFGAPTFDNLQRTVTNGQTSLAGDITFSDLLNLFVFNTKYNMGMLIKALQTTGYFQSLAEPNLIAYNGQEASFLAGGEVPIPIVQGVTGTVSVQYKEYGIRLVFKPTIAGDVIRLRVNPEVSTLDFTNGLSLGGYRIPAITTRRATTDVELRDGQSFAIAGLMNNLSQDTKAAVPWLSKVPVIGAFFRSKAANQERTELMVIVTPRLVRALNPDEVPPLPTFENRFLPAGPPPDGAPSAAPPPASGNQ